MTRVVVYDKDHVEPLTIVEIPERFLREKRRRVKLFVPEDMSTWMLRLDQMTQDQELVSSFSTMRHVSLRLEPIRRGDGRGGSEFLHWHAIPDDEELALLLRAAFLPGQMTEVRRREVAAWLAGAINWL